jgi:hypothetical protein
MDESAEGMEARNRVPHMETGKEIVQIMKKYGKDLCLHQPRAGSGMISKDCRITGVSGD